MIRRPPRSTLFPSRRSSDLEHARLDAIRQAHSRLEQLQDEFAQARERSEEHTSELQSQFHLVCRLLLEKKKNRHRNQKYPLLYTPPTEIACGARTACA